MASHQHRQHVEKPPLRRYVSPFTSWRNAMIGVTCVWCVFAGTVGGFAPRTDVPTPRHDRYSWSLSMAAPGVVLALPHDIRAALQNPATTIVDARSIEELQANGYFTGCESGQAAQCRWVHAPSTGPPNPASPLLVVASASLIPDLKAPVIVHCGSGIRAGIVKTILEGLGYTNVMNAGGLVDLEFTMAG